MTVNIPGEANPFSTPFARPIRSHYNFYTWFVSDVSPATIYAVERKRENERMRVFGLPLPDVPRQLRLLRALFIEWKMWKWGIKGIKLLPAPLSWKWDEKSPIYSIISPNFHNPLFYTSIRNFLVPFRIFSFLIRKKAKLPSPSYFPLFLAAGSLKRVLGLKRMEIIHRTEYLVRAFGFLSF